MKCDTRRLCRKSMWCPKRCIFVSSCIYGVQPLYCMLQSANIRKLEMKMFMDFFFLLLINIVLNCLYNSDITRHVGIVAH